MSDLRQSEGQEPAKWSLAWFLKLASIVFLGQFRIPGWLGIVFAIFWGIPAWQSKFEFWAQVAKSSGSQLAPFAEILLWPYLSPTIALVSFVYLIVVSSFDRSSAAPRNILLVVVAWVSVTAIFLTTIVVAGSGAIEAYVRAEIARGVAGLSRGASPANTPAGDQRPLFGSARSLTLDQQRLLILEGQKLRADLPNVKVAYLPTDNETYALALQLRNTLGRAAINTEFIGQSLTDPNDEGILIEVPDRNSPSIAAIKLMQLLSIADIPARFANLAPGLPPDGMILFIGPRPIQR
jgi:hypothetical protein